MTKTQLYISALFILNLVLLQPVAAIPINSDINVSSVIGYSNSLFSESPFADPSISRTSEYTITTRGSSTTTTITSDRVDDSAILTDVGDGISFSLNEVLSDSSASGTLYDVSSSVLTRLQNTSTTQPYTVVLSYDVNLSSSAAIDSCAGASSRFSNITSGETLFSAEVLSNTSQSGACALIEFDPPVSILDTVSIVLPIGAFVDVSIGVSSFADANFTSTAGIFADYSLTITDVSPASIPEPSTLALMFLGLLATRSRLNRFLRNSL